MLTNAPKGTKDMMPDQAYKWHYIEEAFAEICRIYGFQEIRTPVFEHTELFQRGVGDTTDIVQKEMYSFQDYGKRNITLKPEGTSPVVRAYAEHKLFAGPQPTKFYYNTPCFRYEKPQSGRLREFHQFGIETFGTHDMMADAEIIALASDFLKQMGVTDIELRINSVGCPECRKNHRAALREFLKPKYDELCDTCKDRFDRNPMRILDCKSPVCHELVQGAPMMLDYLCDECKDAFEQLKANLDAMGIEYVVDPGIVRGLDYYTKTVFEFVNSEGFTLCGGGRYDGLIHEIDEKHDIPSVGFGMGIERILYFLEKEGVELPAMETPDLYVGILGADARARAYKLVNEIRSHGLIVETDYMDRSVKAQMKYANKIGAKKVVIIGADELEKGTANVKDMATGEQTEVSLNELPALF